jgi:hypothetical protein
MAMSRSLRSLRPSARNPLSPPSAPPVPLRLLRADRVFPDGSVELSYAPGEPDREH